MHPPAVSDPARPPSSAVDVGIEGLNPCNNSRARKLSELSTAWAASCKWAA